MDFVKNVCDSTMLMRNGKLVLAGHPEEVLAKVDEEGQEMLSS
jgi:ABC-type polysaccharide/polyol phosphate transport system ATPase subunit